MPPSTERSISTRTFGASITSEGACGTPRGAVGSGGDPREQGDVAQGQPAQFVGAVVGHHQRSVAIISPLT